MHVHVHMTSQEAGVVPRLVRSGHETSPNDTKPAASVKMAAEQGDLKESSQAKKKKSHGQKEYCVIHDSEDDGGSLECQLERALERGYPLIIVEPTGLGDETIRWIRVGNFLHKGAVLASLGCILTIPLLPRHISNFTSLPLGAFGVCCAGLYHVSWRNDPCSKYQVDYRGSELTSVPSRDLHSQTPTVLVKRNDVHRRRLQNLLALVVAGYLSWRLYYYFNSS